MKSKELKDKFPEIYRQCFMDEVSRLRSARLEDEGSEISTGAGLPPPNVDASIPPPAKSLDEMKPEEMRARIEKLERDLAESQEKLASINRSGNRDIVVTVNNADKHKAMGIAEPLGELASKAAQRQGILTGAIQKLRRRNR